MQTRNSKDQISTIDSESETQNKETDGAALPENALDVDDPKLSMRPEVRAAYEQSRERYAATYEYLKDR